MRGKHKPIYDNKRGDQGDVCVVVNAAKLLVTGRKMDQKLYRYHTQYFSGLKEFNLRALVEKDPSKVFYLAIKGMLPKNKLREDILKKQLIVHDGPYHTQYNFMLPHFTESLPIDINEQFGLSKTRDKDEYEIAFETDPANRPVELKDLDVVTKEADTIPWALREPSTHSNPKTNVYMGQLMKKQYKHFRKFKKHS
jgi:large subunit ribosomal protein L13